MRNQDDLFSYFQNQDVRRRYGRTTHGGTGTNGRRKLERPLATRRSIHLVLKSHRAKGPLGLLLPRNKIFIENLIAQKAKKFGVKVAELANVGNHLHLKIRISSRDSFQSFLRSISGLIARHVTGARRGHRFGRFWQGLAFTRVLTSSREEIDLAGYIKANQIEALHSSAAREFFLRVFHQWTFRERARVTGLVIYSTA